MIRYLLQPLTWFVTKRYLYHLDKIAHTALLAIALAALSGIVRHPVELTHCAMWAAALYMGVGKLTWRLSASYRRHVSAEEARLTWRAFLPSLTVDWFSDAALSWAVVILAATYEGHWSLAIASQLLFPTVYLYAVATRRTSP